MEDRTEEEVAEEILDCFLFENINNNHNPDEREWGITWEGNEFIVFNHMSERVYNFEVKIRPGNLSNERITELLRDQEWLDE